MAKASIELDIAPYYDFNRHTILKLGSYGGVVNFIPLDVANGLHVQKAKASDFDRNYKPIPDYPIKRAVDLFVSYAKKLGATREVLTFFSKHVSINEEDQQEMAKLAERQEVTEEQKPAKKVKPASIKAAPAEKVTKTAKPKPAKTTESKAPSNRKYSAAQMFKDLILDGKMSDDEIFAEVKAKFNLPDSKRGYVKWYRNFLIKEGTLKEQPVKKGKK